jgi:hypothetical protein
VTPQAQPLPADRAAIADLAAAADLAASDAGVTEAPTCSAPGEADSRRPERR